MNPMSPIPPPALNGGLYTGQHFVKDAPWATVPVRPTSAFMTHMNLRSANPPVHALFQLQAGYRPGNNSDDPMPGVVRFKGDQNFGPFNFMCTPCLQQQKQEESAVPKECSARTKVISIL